MPKLTAGLEGATVFPSSISVLGQTIGLEAAKVRPALVARTSLNCCLAASSENGPCSSRLAPLKQPFIGPVWEAASGLAATINKSLATAPQLTFPLPGASGERFCFVWFCGLNPMVRSDDPAAS